MTTCPLPDRRLDRKLRHHRRRPLHPRRLRDRRRQGRRHGVRRHRAGPAARRAGRHRRAGPLPHPRGLPGRDAGPGRPGQPGHPADLGVQRGAAGRRRLAGRRRDARGAGQRHHRHLEQPRQQLPDAALAPVPHRRAGRRSARSATWCSTRSPSTTTWTTTWPPWRPTARSGSRPPSWACGTSSRSSTPTRRSAWPPRRSAGSSTTRSSAPWPGSPAAHRPLFLKMPYNGADALAELVEHDPSVVVGILGGSAGTTRDTFELLHRAERHGGRVALFGRKIQRAESQLDLVGLMRPVLRGELTPADAVRAYHEALAKAEITAAAQPRGRPGGDRPGAARGMTAPRRDRRAVRRHDRRRRGQGDRRLPGARPPGHDRAGLAEHRRAGPEHGGRPAPARGRRSRSACSARSATTSTARSCWPSARGWASTRPGSTGCPAWPPRSPTRWSSGTAGGARSSTTSGPTRCSTPSAADLAGSAARILHAGAPGLHPLHGHAHGRTAATAGRPCCAGPGPPGCTPTWSWSACAASGWPRSPLPCLPHLDSIVINELEAGALTGIDAPVPGPDGPVDWPALEAMAARPARAGRRALAVVHFPAGCVAAAAGRPDLAAGLGAAAPRAGAQHHRRGRRVRRRGDPRPARGLAGRACLRLGVASAAACVRSPHTSDGIGPAADCLAAADAAGYRADAGEVTKMSNQAGV